MGNRLNERDCDEHRIDHLPDGTFISLPGEPATAWLIRKGHLHHWSHEGYGERRLIDQGGQAIVLTPAPSVEVFRAGYQPVLHPSVMA
jgi:hypothetical protein